MISSLTRTRLQDPDLAGVAALTSPGVPTPLRIAYDVAGTEIDNLAPVTITWWPGSQLTMRFRVEGRHGLLAGPSEAVAVLGAIPEGALEVGDGETRIGVWTLPNDPVLPGLRSALDRDAVNELLAGLGAVERATSIRLRAYRPTRRAVVEVEAGSSSIFLKVVPPGGVEALHERHRHLAAFLPVPNSLGLSRELGIVAMRALDGHDLREVMRRGDPTPSSSEVADLLPSIPAPLGDREVVSPFRGLPRLADLLARLVPERRHVITELVDRLGGETVETRVPAHGDFHEAQLLVSGGRVSGLIDVDTFGWGRPGDDPATMLAHLDLLAPGCRRPFEVRQFALGLNRHWDTLLDPVDLRRRVAAALLGLAVGPFRVQRERWDREIADRLDSASRWVASADRIDERSLITTSASSHADLGS